MEYALAEREFIYSLNRLNVSVTRARTKSILFLSRALLQPPIQALDNDEVAEGIAFMQGLTRWAEQHGETRTLSTRGLKLTIIRAAAQRSAS